jgi:phosphoesterase RecJ-like protein
VITVDVASPDRICDGTTFLNKAKTTINIDHHKTNSCFAHTNIVEADTSSTCEVILNLADELNWEITHDAALALYVGILTDTGSFRFDNTKPATLKWAARLVELGVNVSETYRKVYESETKATALFQSFCVSKATFLNDDSIAYITVYRKDLEKFGASEESMEGLTEKLRAIKSVQVAFVAKEMKSGFTKVSMRTKEKDSATICAKFGGGGHKFAAGCMINSTPSTAAKKLLEEILLD